VGTEHEDERHQVRFLIGSGDLEELARQQDAEEADGPEDDERDAEAPADEDSD
jgi:hypothetical protein